MSKKYRILHELEKRKDCFVSGEMLGRLLNISRTAVWKYVEELRKEGYDLKSSSRKGYKYNSSFDVINGYEVTRTLDTSRIGKEVYYYDSITSTNDVAKKLASEKEGEGMLVIADTQLSGRGRMGRKWISGAGKGVWMSVVLKPDITPEEAQLFTLAASVAVSGAIEKATGLTPGIKWPNDVLLSGRKVCGILTEMSAETDRVNFVVIGIGINCTQEKEDFPPEIRDTAISIKEALAEKKYKVTFSRLDIIKETLSILEKTYDLIEEGHRDELLDQWKRFSITLGKKVIISHGNAKSIGMAEDITQSGALVVRYDDGTRKELFSGEVSIKDMASSF